MRCACGKPAVPLTCEQMQWGAVPLCRECLARREREAKAIESLVFGVAQGTRPKYTRVERMRMRDVDDRERELYA